MRLCPCCEKTKPVEEFYARPLGKLDCWCKLCSRAATKARADLNRENLRSTSREYHTQNREAILARQKQNRVKNRPRTAAYMNKRREDPVFRMVENMRRRVRDVTKRGTKLARTFVLVGCSVSEFRAHLESLFRLGMTWENYGPVWHIDHIRPCSSFNMSIKEDQFACFHWSNQQPLFASENLKKSDKYEKA